LSIFYAKTFLANWFLPSIYEVNIEYRFSGRIRTFNRRKNNIYEKIKSVSLPSVKQCCPGISFFRFKLEAFSFWVRKTLVLCGAYWFFIHFNELLRVTPEQKFGFFKIPNSLKTSKHLKSEYILSFLVHDTPWSIGKSNKC
jgi:hypothetical protein